MRSPFSPAVLVAALTGAIFLGSPRTSVSQSTEQEEIVIHYRGNGAGIPAPRREGNNYVIAIPRRFDPIPQKLIAPFVNSIEGENEVWRFEIKGGAPIAVTQVDNGTIRVRIGERQATANPTSAQRHDVPKRTASNSNAAPDAVESAGGTEVEDADNDDTMAVAAPPTPARSPLNVDANGSAVTVAQISPDSGVSTVKSPTLPLANLDLAVPQSPAFAILGITPDNIIRPGSPRELALSLLNGIGENGAFQSGIAIDTAPYLLFAGKTKTLEDYQNNYSVRLLSRTQLSFATSKGAQDKDPSLKLALGLHMTFFDKGDPRLDDEYIGKLSAAFFGSALGHYINPRDRAAIAAAKQQFIDAARKAAKERNWNRSSWSMGLAPSWIDKAGDSGNYDWNGGAAWTSLAYGFDTQPFTDTSLEKNSQLILHLRYRNHDQIPDPAVTGSFYTEDNFLAALRLRVGSPDFNVSLDGAYVREWNAGTHDGSSYRLAFVLERKMAANLWFRLSYGKEFDTPDDKDSSLFLGSFHLGASEEATGPAK